MSGSDGLSQVSVIIPTYNRSRLLRLAVESVLAQTYPNTEVIVVDDGSTDDTATVMAHYAERVTYIKQTNKGVEAARNAGIHAASGEYINFLDDDDLFLPTKLERQVRVLDARPEIALAHCRYYHMDADGNFLDKVGLLPEGEVLRELVCACFVWSGAPLIRRRCIEHVGLFDEETWSASADWDMWLRIARASYRFACVQEPLGAYRIVRDSMMADVAKLEHGVVAVLDKVFSDTELPADVVAIREQAYGIWRSWLSCRYYAAGRWEEARRNLAEALALRPHHLLERPEELVRFLANDALNLRVADPVQFVNDVLDHLPSRVDDLHRYRSQFLSQIYTGLALRNYGLGDITEAKEQLAEAIALNPAILEQTDVFAEMLYYKAMRLPLSAPLKYVDTVLQNLPAGAQRLQRVRARVLSEVSIANAFQDYAAGQRGQVVREVLTALRYRPSWFGNRGVVSIFLKSLSALLVTERSSV